MVQLPGDDAVLLVSAGEHAIVLSRAEHHRNFALKPPSKSLTTLTTPISPTTAQPPSPQFQPLSSRAREKQPARRRFGPVNNIDLARSHPFYPQPQSHESATAPALPVTALGAPTATASPQSQIQRPQPAYRRSFLETLLARQQNREILQNRRPDSSRVLNPINHVPRPTPIRIPPRSSHEQPPPVETKSLLTLPEQRRSRQNSPVTPTVEHSPRLDPGVAQNRSSIGLPSNQRRASYPISMSAGQDPVRSEDDGTQEEKVNSRGGGGGGGNNRKEPVQRYKNSSRDLESQISSPQTAPFPGATYGLNPSDQPSHPPRRVTSRASKASLRKQRSSNSIHTDSNAPPPLDTGSNNPDAHPDESLAEELAWNSSHPCFPHPNPHVPLSSPLYQTTRVIRVKRDWMAHGDLAPSYSNIYPEILDPLVPESEFRFLLNHVNTSLLEAFDPFRAWNWVDGLLSLATGWLWEDLRPGGVKGKLKALEFWIEQWNKRVGSREGVRVIPLRRTGYMSLDIEIPDPQVRVVDEGMGGDDGVEQEEGDDSGLGYGVGVGEGIGGDGGVDGFYDGARTGTGHGTAATEPGER